MSNELPEGYELRDDLEDARYDEVMQLMRSAGWGERNAEDLRDAFRRSSARRFCFHEGRLVGMGRSVDDGHYYAQIVDVVVDARHRGRGIGRCIVADLATALEGFLFTTLTAAPGRHSFYDSIGWHRQTSAFIWPRDERQAREHGSG